VRVPTGVAIEAPEGYDVQIRPRSGLSAQGIMATLGTIDADYRGELLVTMYVLSYRHPHTVRDGDRIAQLVIGRLAQIDVVEAEALSETERGAGGHGSTGR
jgi:dUTP pyrophosphatase